MPQPDIEFIVREVLRRLRQVVAADASSGQAADATDAADAGTLALAQRVVTLADVAQSLDGIKRVVTSRRAVVTPAARDYLRDKGVELIRRSLASSQCSRPAPILLWLTSDVAAGWLHAARSACQRGASLSMASAEIAEVVSGVGAELARKPPRASIVITGRPASAACALNRKPAMRAAIWARGQSLESLQVDAQPNVLILDANGQGPYELPLLVERWRPASPNSSTLALLPEML